MTDSVSICQLEIYPLHLCPPLLSLGVYNDSLCENQIEVKLPIFCVWLEVKITFGKGPEAQSEFLFIQHSTSQPQLTKKKKKEENGSHAQGSAVFANDQEKERHQQVQPESMG